LFRSTSHFTNSLIEYFFDSQKDENKIDRLSFKTMTTESNTNMDASLEAAENGMRKRGKHPDALKPTNKALSTLSEVSKMYDVDGDGKLDASEQAMRDMDTDNRGYLTNEKVYKVMLEQMKLQNEVFGLKRMSLVFVFIMFFLSLATLGTSFAAASLAKDTNVKNGIMVQKGGDGSVVGTRNAAATFIVTEGDPSTRRRAQNIGTEDESGAVTVTDSVAAISKSDAALVHDECRTGGTVFLERTCGAGSTIVDVPICPSTERTILDGPIYEYRQTVGDALLATIDCTGKTVDTELCPVSFNAASKPVCPSEAVVDIGSAKNYAILAKSGITTVPTSEITGDIGVSPIAETAMTGFSFTKDATGLSSTSIQITGEGKAYAADTTGGTVASDLTAAVSDMEAAYTNAAGRTRGTGLKLNFKAGLLNEDTLTPGVYTFDTGVSISGNIYFRGNANDVFIIQIAGVLTQAANFEVFLLGGAQAKNIFWQVSGTVQVGAGAHMKGVLLAKTAVTFITGSTLTGRVLTQTMCALQMTTVDSRICSYLLC
jgi:hypothetical protein